MHGPCIFFTASSVRQWDRRWRKESIYIEGVIRFTAIRCLAGEDALNSLRSLNRWFPMCPRCLNLKDKKSFSHWRWIIRWYLDVLRTSAERDCIWSSERIHVKLSSRQDCLKKERKGRKTKLWSRWLKWWHSLNIAFTVNVLCCQCSLLSMLFTVNASIEWMADWSLLTFIMQLNIDPLSSRLRLS